MQVITLRIFALLLLLVVMTAASSSIRGAHKHLAVRHEDA